MELVKKIIKWVLFSAFLIALFAFSFIANQKRAEATVGQLNVEFEDQELHFISDKDVVELLPFIDSSGYGQTETINLQMIEDKIHKNPYVENCDAFINNREHLTVKVKQKVPLFRVFHHNGVSYYVDRMGIKFPISDTFTANVPIASGRITYDVDSLGIQRGQAINDLITFFEFVNEDQLYQALVSHVEVKSNGDLVFTPRTGKHTVNIGSPEDLEDKMYRLTTFYKEGLNQVGWDKYKQVSVKYENQIIATKN